MLVVRLEGRDAAVPGPGGGFSVTVSRVNVVKGTAVEILCDARETPVAGVHFHLADRAGLPASGGLTNSPWKEFKEVRPTDGRGGSRS
jgi:hypothetical protein